MKGAEPDWGEVLEFGGCVSGRHPAPARDVPCRSRGLPSLPDTSLSVRRVLRAVGGDGHDLCRISYLSRPGQMAPAPFLMSCAGTHDAAQFKSTVLLPSAFARSTIVSFPFAVTLCFP